LATCIISTFLFYSNNSSENNFLGRPIAQDYSPESPGYTQVKLYKDGIATVAYGGILGIHKEFFVDYKIENDTIILIRDEGPIDLLNETIYLDQKRYHVKF